MSRLYPHRSDGEKMSITANRAGNATLSRGDPRRIRGDVFFFAITLARV